MLSKLNHLVLGVQPFSTSFHWYWAQQNLPRLAAPEVVQSVEFAEPSEFPRRAETNMEARTAKFPSSYLEHQTETHMAYQILTIKPSNQPKFTFFNFWPSQKLGEEFEFTSFHVCFGAAPTQIETTEA